VGEASSIVANEGGRSAHLRPTAIRGSRGPDREQADGAHIAGVGKGRVASEWRGGKVGQKARGDEVGAWRSRRVPPAAPFDSEEELALQEGETEEELSAELSDESNADNLDEDMHTLGQSVEFSSWVGELGMRSFFSRSFFSFLMHSRV
jgi:hypothetical protein